MDDRLIKVMLVGGDEKGDQAVGSQAMITGADDYFDETDLNPNLTVLNTKTSLQHHP